MRKVLYLMGVLNDMDVQWLAKNGTKRLLDIGTTLITAGVHIDHLSILLDGRLAVEVANGVQVATLLAGEVVGEISFVDERPPLASVVSVFPSVVLQIDKVMLQRKLASDGQFGARFYKAISLFLADRLRSTTGRLGYGSGGSEEIDDPDELDADQMQIVSMANVRFDTLVHMVG